MTVTANYTDVFASADYATAKGHTSANTAAYDGGGTAWEVVCGGQQVRFYSREGWACDSIRISDQVVAVSDLDESSRDAFGALMERCDDECPCRLDLDDAEYKTWVEG